MFSVKNILVPVDFSDTSRAAISAALQIAATNKATVYVLHIESGMENDVDQGNEEAASALARIETDEAALMAAVNLEKKRCAEGDRDVSAVKVEARVSGGSWKDVANQMVDELNIELIVTATHGPQNLRERVVGSDSQRLLGLVTCSVLVVKPKGYPYLRD